MTLPEAPFKKDPYSSKSLVSSDFLKAQPYQGGYIVTYQGEHLGTVKKLKSGWRIDAIGKATSGRTFDVLQRATELLDAYQTSPGAREARGVVRAPGHVVRDFNTLNDLIAHSGATHLDTDKDRVTNRLYVPEGKGYRELRVWQKEGFWHAQAPDRGKLINRLPSSAAPIINRPSKGKSPIWQRAKRALGVEAKKRTATWTTQNTQISTWFERDRASVVLDTLDGTTIIEWWDEAVQEAVDDGFLNPSDWHGSAVEYANSVGAQPQMKARQVRQSPRRSSHHKAR